MVSMEITNRGIAGRGLTARVSVPSGTEVLTLRDCRAEVSPSVHTIQVGLDDHVDGPLIKYLNHSCAPNLHIDTVTGSVYAIRNVDAEEEFTFFYPSTEWDMVGPFRCLCASPDCIGVVSGARNTPIGILDKYLINPHIIALLQADAVVR